MSTIVPSTIAVVPCLNEAESVGRVVPALLRRVAGVIVVDDGSTDATAGVAQRCGAVVLRHSRPLGKGAALAAGWTRARELGAEWGLLLDGDGQHDPDESEGFFRQAEDGAQLVIGDRLSSGDPMPWVRRQTNRWVSRRISALAGCPIPDALCGYRLVHLPSLDRLRLHSRHYEIESEMTVAAVRAGLRLAFVPIRSRYGTERSKIRPARDTIRWFCWYLGVHPMAGRSPSRIRTGG